VAAVAACEHGLRDELRRLKEMAFYRRQCTNEALADIEDYLTNILSGQLQGGLAYAPAYLEWAVWRLFLAINEILPPISETRGFNIDEDMHPVHHARGGAADLTLEYDDFVIVCEATLTSGSRQFAAEGEPVTRHVFKATKDHGDKPVYGLFVAGKVDPNTVDAFHSARYWEDWENSTPTPVVAVDIDHLIRLVRAMREKRVPIAEMRRRLDHILDMRAEHETGPRWYAAYRPYGLLDC
jgi:hypothetical protein